MSRLYIPGNAVDQNQVPVVGATIFVRAGGVNAALENAAGESITNPLTTVANGFFEAFSTSAGSHTLEYYWGGKLRRVDTISAPPEGALLIQDEITATSYTLAADDAFTGLPFNNASAITVTIPPASAVAFESGAWMEFYQVGAGAITFAAGSGVTLRASGDRLTSGGQHSLCVIRYVGSDVWYVAGDRA